MAPQPADAEGSEDRNSIPVGVANGGNTSNNNSILNFSQATMTRRPSVGFPLNGLRGDDNNLQQVQNQVAFANAAATVTTAHLLQQQLILQQQAAALLAAATPLTHNLIPAHLQASALAASLNGTPGYSPALIAPPLFAIPQPLSQPSPNLITPSLISQFQSMTLQDRALLDPSFIPQFNGLNPNYPGVRVLRSDPPVFAVDQFLTPIECQFLVAVASDSFGPAPVVGKGAGEVSASRTSSTCYLSREDLPDLMRKVSLLTGKPIEHCELPQVGRYLPSQQYLQHFDAFDTSSEDGRRFASNGGQRTITVLIYLNDVMRGGATRFPALNLDVQPRQGTALVFFPATVDGHLDKRALHAALPAVDAKYVSQVWIRQSTYNGQPSKRLAQPMGAPLNPPLGAQQPVPAGQAPGLVLSGAASNAGSMIPNPLAANNLPATF